MSKKGIKTDLLIYENSDYALDKEPETAMQARNIIKDYAEMYF